jgi:beta-galactosidase
LKVITYKNGKLWATTITKTTGPAQRLVTAVDRDVISADGKDIAFITVQVSDKVGLLVPRSHNVITFTIDGPGEIVATDNGDPTNMETFGATTRAAFNGLCLGIVKAIPGQKGKIRVTVTSSGLEQAQVNIECR